MSHDELQETSFTQSLTPPQKRPLSRLQLASRTLALCLLPAAALLTTHELPDVAPLAADALRSAIGVDGVARLEDSVYAAKDAVNLTLREGEAPKSYWSVDAQSTSQPNRTSASPSLGQSAPSETPAPSSAQFQEPGWQPAPASVPFSKVSTKSDGHWVEIDGSDGRLQKTMLHPDPKRSWAELFVVAIDLSGSELHWVPGTREPEALSQESSGLNRTGRIAEHNLGALLGAFNGGFKTQHGKFGARQDGLDLVAPRSRSCTLGATHDGEIVLGSYSKLENTDDLVWLRQTPNCMIEAGELHAGLQREDSTHWGATLEGGTVIRRSAIGLSEDGKTLYMGISNDTTARALAIGMSHAGAHTVAQLDVNYSYPRFVLFEGPKDALVPTSLVDGFVMHEDQYLRAEARDFFYLTHKPR